MKIIVISLRSSQRRRENIRRQFQLRGMHFEFFDAVCGDEATQYVHHYDEKQFRINTGRVASINEIGCYASHLAVWKRCASGNEPVLILEDDAELSIQFEDGVRAIEHVIRRRGFVRASLPTVSTSTAIEKLHNFRLRYCRRVPLLALGYALTPAVAARLVDCGSVVQEPVDKFVQRFWRHGQPVFAIRPYIVHLGVVSHESDIGERIRERYTLALWFQRALRKASNSMQREWFNLCFLFALRRSSAARRRTVLQHFAG